MPYYDDDGDGKLDLWAWRLYDRLGPIGEDVAASLNILIVWGGRWKGLRDGPHWELSFTKYPSDEDWPNQAYNFGGKFYPPTTTMSTLDIFKSMQEG